MKRKRHPPEEIIKKLREAATLLAGGQSVEAVGRKLEVSPPTYHRWRQEYGGAREETVKRLKELEKENERLKRLGAERVNHVWSYDFVFDQTEDRGGGGE
jgi:transposase-like protein